MLLGHTCTASTILPFGSYLSISLHQWLNACLAKLEASLPPKASQTPLACCIKTIWRTSRNFQVLAHIARNIMFIRQLLVIPLANDIWSRPIDLLIPCSFHIASFTDVSYKSLGGFIVALNFKCRISSDDLSTLGWTVFTTEPERYKQLPVGKIHINVLDLLTVFCPHLALP